MTIPLLIATTNPGKIIEIEHELDAAGLRPEVALRTLKDLPTNTPDCVEDRPTFIGNATKKARHFARLANGLTLADDSGLCVDALQGAPGVNSARYAVGGAAHAAVPNRPAIDAANNAKLLRELDSVPDHLRHAQFVCAMALAIPAATLAVFVHQVHGILLRAPRGSNGFGYDPLFYFADLQKTTAELATNEKSQISHRGKTLRRLLAWLHDHRDALPALPP